MLVPQVKHVKLIADKNSRRSKGIAYVEFVEEGSVQLVCEWVCPYGCGWGGWVCPYLTVSALTVLCRHWV